MHSTYLSILSAASLHRASCPSPLWRRFATGSHPSLCLASVPASAHLNPPLCLCSAFVYLPGPATHSHTHISCSPTPRPPQSPSLSRQPAAFAPRASSRVTPTRQGAPGAYAATEAPSMVFQNLHNRRAVNDRRTPYAWSLILRRHPLRTQLSMCLSIRRLRDARGSLDR